MARSPRKRRTPNRGATRRPASQGSPPAPVVPVDDQPLIQALRQALRAPSGIDFLGVIGAILESLESVESVDERPLSLPEFAETFIDVNVAETTAALHVLAEFTTDELLAARIRRELAGRHQPVPPLLTSLPQLHVTQAWLLTDDLGDADNYLFGIGGLPEPASLAVLVHRHAAAVTDASVVPIDVEELRADFVANVSGGAAPVELSPADARARLESAMADPPPTVRPCGCTEPTDTWPAFRPLARRVCRTLPTGGTGYPTQPFTAEQRAAVCAQITAHRFYEQGGFATEPGSTDQTLLARVVDFAGTAGFTEPWRWSPRRLEELLDDSLQWGLDDDELDALPGLLDVVVRVAGDHEGLSAKTIGATRETLEDLTEDFDLDLSSGFGSPLAEILDPPTGERAESMLRTLRAGMGGPEALDALDTARITPLVDVPVEAALSHLPKGAEQRLREADTLACDAIDHLVDASVREEVRAAFHALLARLGERDPAKAARGKPAVTAAALIWAVARANDLIGDGDEAPLMQHFRYGPDSPPEADLPPGLVVKNLVAHLGVGPSIQPRARALLGACGYSPETHGMFFTIGDPALLIANKRLRIALERDWVRKGVGDRT